MWRRRRLMPNATSPMPAAHNHGAGEGAMDTREKARLALLNPRRLVGQGLSTIIVTALPPPRQSVVRPRFALRSFIAYKRVVSTRAPLQPIGWPSATAPPFTLNFS